MSLKRRNIIAFILILFAAVCWTFGQQMLDTNIEGDISNTTYPATEATIIPTTVETVYPSDNWTTTPNSAPTTSESWENDCEETSRSERMLGMILSFAAAIAGIIAIFVLSQKNAIIGPDGICLALALLVTAYHISLNMEYIFWWTTIQTLTRISEIVCAFVVLLCIRELFGWIRERFSLSWCLAQRIAKRCTAPQVSLLVFVVWIVIPLVILACFWGPNVYEVFWICVVGFIATSTFGFLCLWKYGNDLSHFKKQLNNYQHGKPITVDDGAFAQTEAQLLDVQAQHEEAVRTAVTSERFKVELISNVSHDLRTPLTSILGYSELLQNEALSPEGQEQLRRLHQKAGYMNDLVESLFELTKVSSGVVESKKEQIDLVRLMEQTIGLFDDQLVSAGLIVKRSYCADTIPAITDGARMHQVFANYILGAIARRIQPKINPWLGIVGALTMSAILGAATVLSTDGKLSEALTWEFPDLWIAFIVVCLFVALYRVRIPSAISRILAFGSSGCYGGYLLSHLFDAWCYKLVPSWRTPEHYALIFFGITVPIFIVSLLLGALLERVNKWPCTNRKGASKCLH